MPILKFDKKEVAQLYHKLKNAQRLYITSDMSYDASLYPNNVIVDENGNPEGHPDFTWPDRTKIDLAKVKPTFMLVHDQGVYLMGNHDRERKDGESRTIVYCDGCQPDKDEFWYEYSVDLVGGDDFCVDVPVEWVEHCLNSKARHFRIDWHTNSYRLG